MHMQTLATVNALASELGEARLKFEALLCTPVAELNPRAIREVANNIAAIAQSITSATYRA